ncbi:MAG: hypothetical protein Dbin4_03022 [Alphaproteobacteria bacterium]|nr:hypothetical protein [Alphaproteobacteria bacterium]
MSVILCLDLGTQTGWAMIGNDDLVSAGTVSFAPRKGEGPGARYSRFMAWLIGFHSEHEQIDAVHYEDVRRHIGTQAAHVYGGLLAVLQMWAEQENIPCGGAGVGVIKKHATGNGAAKKPAMIEAMKARGYSVIDDNAADALALLDYVIAKQP